MIYSIDGADVPLVVRRQEDHYTFLTEAVTQDAAPHSQDTCPIEYSSSCDCEPRRGYQRWSKISKAELQREVLLLK